MMECDDDDGGGEGGRCALCTPRVAECLLLDAASEEEDGDGGGERDGVRGRICRCDDDWHRRSVWRCGFGGCLAAEEAMHGDAVAVAERLAQLMLGIKPALLGGDMCETSFSKKKDEIKQHRTNVFLFTTRFSLASPNNAGDGPTRPAFPCSCTASRCCFQHT
jgi:hypothetical protein